jgi:serine/threonine protein kinase
LLSVLQVLQSLAFLHSLGLVHSDLKPENILIKSYSRCDGLTYGEGGVLAAAVVSCSRIRF